MKRFLALALALLFVVMLASCGQEETPGPTSSIPSSNSSNTTDSSNPSDSENSNVPNTPPDDDTDLGPNDKNDPSTDTERPTVEETLGEVLDVFAGADTYGKNEGNISSYTDYVNVDVSGLEGGKQYKIEKGGIYRVYGKTANGQLYVKAKDQKVILLLDGVDIAYAGSGPAIYAEGCQAVTIILAEGSSNYVADSSVNGENGAIRVRSCDLTMGGKGKLTVKGNAKHGISCTKNLVVNGGIYNVTSVRHGFYGKLSLTINDGKYTIKSARSGFKSGDDEVGSEEKGKIIINSCSANIKCNTNGINSYGSVEINDGRIVVEALGKGIVATDDIDIKGGLLILNTTEDAVKSDTAINVTGNSNVKITTNGNGFECVNVNDNGTITVSTTGVVYVKTLPVFFEDTMGEYKLSGGEYVLLDGTESVTVKRYSPIECKGFEADGKVTLSKTTVGIDSFEDGVNSTDIEVNGAKVVVYTTRDAMDSSTNIVVSGTANINIISSNKGLRATNTVTLNSGDTTIVAETDAIKADSVSVMTGNHILFEKVEYVTNFTVRGGTLLCLSTTNNPVSVKATIPNASGVISNKALCNVGQYFTVIMGSKQVTVVLPMPYSEKMCVLFAAESQGECKVIIGNNEKTEILTQGSFYS